MVWVDKADKPCHNKAEEGDNHSDRISIQELCVIGVNRSMKNGHVTLQFFDCCLALCL